MSGPKKLGVLKLVVAIVTVLLLILLIPTWLDSIRQMPDVASNPECPHAYDTLLALPGNATNVPEYHDCQRLLKKSGEGFGYGALAGVFVRINADTIRFPAVNVGPRTSGGAGGAGGGGSVLPPPAAGPIRPVVTVVAPFIPTPAEEPGVRGNAIAVAEIRAWDQGYDNLGVAQGLNCLYVTKVQPANAPTYQYAALMVPVSGTDDSVCLPVGAPSTGGKWLKVTYTPPTPGHPYLPVARWEWDSSSMSQLVSMICGTDWCEVGSEQSQPAPNRNVSATTPDDEIQWEQKGRYDEQRLALWQTSGGMTPSSVVATASPHRDLDTYTDKEQFHTAWLPVAHTVLPSALPDYLKKFNYGAGTIPGLANEVSLCSGGRFGCLGIYGMLQSVFVPCWKSEDGEVWWAKIVSSSGETKYRCTARRIHDMVKVPAAARWRWKMNDEGLWTSCAQGCCEVYGDE